MKSEIELREELIEELKNFFGKDARRINHALNVLRFAEEIAGKENAEEKSAVIAAAVLHDVGIREGERLHGSSAPRYQEEYGPPVAADILKKLGCDNSFSECVCEMIANHHHPKRYFEANPGRPALPFHVLVDADLIVNVLDGDVTLRSDEKFFTGAAKIIAAREGCIK